MLPISAPTPEYVIASSHIIYVAIGVLSAVILIIAAVCFYIIQLRKRNEALSMPLLEQGQAVDEWKTGDIYSWIVSK